ncbi:DUF192 domain-containing protein [Neomegalonema sp.]|uniref:DUF192 domain-containing protein n=1 Tax=Neomegalonema sp. TaxID=2039713 RepID=UPI00262150DA|nr:DUF192 domain-containing protein [Neomegalonema sp.]MDD2868603.1 DUF192 domain-containing protein [Neomegalonema sp.]
MIRNEPLRRSLTILTAVLALGSGCASTRAAPAAASPALIASNPEEAALETLDCAAARGRIGFAGREEAAFAVEIAADAESQRQGLMWREALGPEAGMLFIFSPPRPSQFWMKNTIIPLDMIFIDPRGRIQHIEREAVPGDLAPRGPARAVSGAVLEIAGGRAAEVGLELGDLAVCLVEEARSL